MSSPVRAKRPLDTIQEEMPNKCAKSSEEHKCPFSVLLSAVDEMVKPRLSHVGGYAFVLHYLSSSVAKWHGVSREAVLAEFDRSIAMKLFHLDVEGSMPMSKIMDDMWGLVVKETKFHHALQVKHNMTMGYSWRFQTRMAHRNPEAQFALSAMYRAQFGTDYVRVPGELRAVPDPSMRLVVLRFRKAKVVSRRLFSVHESIVDVRTLLLKHTTLEAVDKLFPLTAWSTIGMFFPDPAIAHIVTV